MEHHTAEPKASPEKDLVRRQVERILSSSTFHGSKRCQDFLTCVVTMTLDGDSENIKERTLAVEVFGRNANTDLDHDSIVRVGAREVRKRLVQYYATEGAGDVLRVELPTGSYIPVFHIPQAEPPPAPAAPLPPVEEPAGAEAAPVVIQPSALPVHTVATTVSPSPARWKWVAAIAALAVIAAVIVFSLWRPALEPFDAFWQPAFRQKNPLLIVLAHPIVYHPSTRASKLNKERNNEIGPPFLHPLQLPPDSLNGSDFVPVFDQYVGFGDSVAASRISQLFSQHANSPKLRLASKLDFPDLRDSGAVLIGAFTNRWAMQITKDLRYRFGMSGEKPAIVDSTNGKQWTPVQKSDNGSATEDYMMICRLPDAQTGKFVVVAAGLTQYGTEETGRILASPEVLTPILAKLPSGWQGKNLQIVLHSEIVGDSPAEPNLIASYVW